MSSPQQFAMPSVRATTSKLSARSSPSIPPATQVYEPAARAVLRHRQITSIFPFSLLFCWLSTVAWIVWSLGGPSNVGLTGTLVLPFWPMTFFSAFIAWACVALPAILLRKIYLNSSRSCTTSPSTTLSAALARTSTTRALTTYAISSFFMLALHVGIAYKYEKGPRGDPKLGIFVKSRKHPHYLNGRLLFLAVAQLMASLAFLLRNIMLDRFVFFWRLGSTLPSTRHPVRVLDVLGAIAITSIFTTITIPCAAVIYALARFTLPLLYRLPLFHLALRPFTAHFLRGSWTLLLPIRHYGLICRAWSLVFTTVFIWEVSETVFEAYCTKPVVVSHMTPDPTTTLVSGISSTDGVFRYFAYSELRDFAADPSTAASTRRSALFADQKYQPSLWSHLVRESLLVLGNDYQLFLRRGAPPAPAPPPATPKPPISAGPPIATPISLIKKPIYQPGHRSPIQSVMESLSSEGPFAKALDAGADAAHIPELFRSVEAAVLPSSPKKPEVTKTEAAPSSSPPKEDSRTKMNQALHRFLPFWILEHKRRLSAWWSQDRLHRKVQKCLPNREMDVVIVEALSHLVCASLTEDKFGVVQRDTPKIIEAMLSFLSAVEEYQIEIQQLYIPPPPDAEISLKELEKAEASRIEVALSGETLGFVADALKEGVARITRTFGDKLLAFKFPPRTAQKLQGFLEYC